MAERKPVVLVGGQLEELPDGDTLPPQTPATHSHATSDVTGLDAALAGKSSTGHGHAIGDVSGLQSALDTKQATLVSGTSIKTLGGVSLLGYGDIPSGSGLVRSARASNSMLAMSDKGALIDITSGTFTQTFSAVATLGDGWWCYLRNSGTGVITLDPDGSETIDGVATKALDPGQTVIVQCDGTALRTVTVSGAGRHEVVLRTGNGRGSTNTKIRRFTTTVVNVGTAITYADSATLGATFTINEHGAYSIIYQDDIANGDSSGISKNSSQLSTVLSAINSSDVLAFAFPSATVAIVPISAVVRCVPGDVIRAHTENSTTDANVMFSIRRVSP